jgi:hypothetical protein
MADPSPIIGHQTQDTEEEPMPPQPRATSQQPVPATVEPSRAWILGLVVESDGSIASSLGAIPEWSAARQVTVDPTTCECPDACAIDHEYA